MSIKSGYTRVSQIISQWNKYDNVDPFALANKSAIGTMVHQEIEAIEKDICTEPLPKEAQGYLNSYKLWRKSFNYAFTQQETRLYDDELKITGMFDAIAYIPESNTSHLIDFKCTVNADHKLWPMQSTFYWLLAKANDLHLSPVTYFVKLDKNGNMPTVLTYIIDNTRIATAMCAYRTYIYLNT